MNSSRRPGRHPKGFKKITGESRLSQEEQEDSDHANDAGMPADEETPLNQRQDMYPREYLKTLSSIVFLLVATLCGAFVIGYIHQYSMAQPDPLPDIVFQFIPQQQWAWATADIVVMICPLVTFAVLLFHKHWTIVFRRICVISGSLYLIRAAFLLCTYLPPPFLDSKERCLPANFSSSPSEYVKQAFNLVFKGGYSVGENRIMCGDTIYSGHTMVFTLVCLILWYDCPKPLYPFFPVAMIITSAFGITTVIISRQHYTIDVVVAIFVTCAFFYGYHTWTKRPRDKRCFTLSPFKCRPIYFLFLFYEGNVARGPLPCELAWPFPFPKIFIELFDKINDWCHRTERPTSNANGLEV